MKFIIPGQPIAKKRHRYAVRKNKGKMFVQNYDPQSDDKRKVQGQMLYQLTMALNNQDQEIAKEASSLTQERAFEVDMQFHMPVCESSTNSKRNAKFWNLIEHTLKPDLDNLEKFYLDCGNGILFPDDRYVTKVTKKKLYSNNPRTEITVKVKKEPTLPYYTSILAPIIDKENLLKLAKDLNFLATLGFSYYETMNEEQQMVYIESLASFLMDFSKNWAQTLSKIAKKTETINKEEICKKKQL